MARLIAIDLGAYSVKVSEFHGTGKVFEAEGQYVQRVPQDGSEVPSLGHRLAAFDMMLDQHPEWASSGATVAVLWPAELCAIHRIQLPFTDPAQIEKTLPFAIEGEVPFDLDDMLLASRTRTGDGSSTVIVTLTREDPVQQMVDALAERGLDPRHVLLDADVQGYWIGAGKVGAVLDVGHTHTLVSVVQDGQVALCRAVNVGGLAFTRAIQRALDCGWGDAETLKHGEEDAPDVDATDPAFGRMPGKARKAIDEAIGLLLAEVRTTLIHAEDVLGVEIDEIRLTGGGGRLPELRGYLSQDLGVEVRLLEDPHGAEVPPSFAASHALAARLAGQTYGGEIDLRVGDLAYRGGLDLSRSILTYGGAGLGFFLVAVLLMSAWQYRALSKEQADLQQRTQAVIAELFPEWPADAIPDGTTAVAVLREELADAQARAEVLSGERDIPPTIDLLYDLTTAFPPPEEVRVDVDSLDITKAAIIIKAETDSYSSLEAIEENLRKNPRFGSAASGDGERNSRGALDFTISIDRTSSTPAEEPASEEG